MMRGQGRLGRAPDRNGRRCHRRRGRPHGRAAYLAALVIEWDDGPHAKLNTDEIVGELKRQGTLTWDRLRRISVIATTPYEGRHQGRGDLPGSASRTRRWSR
jgi:hypothetical protein